MVMTIADENSWSRIENVIHTSPFIHWIANIKLVTPWMLNPYWKYQNQEKSIIINNFEELSDEIPSEIIYQNFDLKKDQLLRFDTFRTSKGVLKLVMSFHHILFDGRGSRLIVRHLTQNLDFNQENLHLFFPKKIKKINFIRHTINMFQVKKYVESTMKKPIGHIANLEKEDELKKFNLVTHNFTEDETKHIDKTAKDSGARFGSNLYQIACTAISISRNLNFTEDIWIPIPYDGRRRGSIGPVVSNNISFLFYRLKINELTSVSETIQSMQSQMNEQLKLEMPRKYNELLQFMKFIPKGFYFWMTTRAGKGEISSFLYSSSGESFWDTSKFSPELTDTLLIPPFTYPPGISITFLRNDGKLKMNIAASNNKLNNKQLSLFENSLIELLLTSETIEPN